MASVAPVSRFQDDSYSFFTLPPELRLKIYNFLMRTGIPSQDACMVVNSSGLVARSLSGQLLRLCKTIYSEAIRILYKSPSTIAGLDMFVIPGALKTIGPTACSLIHHLSIVWTRLPFYITQTNKKELLALGLCEHLVARPHRMPDLPSLKTITFDYNVVFSTPTHGNPTEAEEFFRGLVNSKPGHGYFLSEHMRMVGERADVEWIFKISTLHCELAEQEDGLIEVDGVKFGFAPREEFSIDLKVELEPTGEASKSRKASKRWKFTDLKEGAKDDVYIWRIDRSEQGPDGATWQPFRSLKAF